MNTVISSEIVISIRAQLERIRHWGARLYLNGEQATEEDILSKCVNEDTIYMPDYVVDEVGNLQEVHYDEILFL